MSPRHLKWILSSKWQSRSISNRRRYCTPRLHRYTKRRDGGWSWIAFLPSRTASRLPSATQTCLYSACNECSFNGWLPMQDTSTECRLPNLSFCLAVYLPPSQIVISFWLTHDSLPGVPRVIINQQKPQAV